jgi:hypothetical protein
MKNKEKNIIGYIHICQKNNWKKSFDMLMTSIKKSGLYDSTYELRLGIVNDSGILLNDNRFNEKKIKIIYVGKSKEYERPTLLHMKKMSYIDKNNTLYYYLHTKGITHFNTINEKYIVNWIEDMLYWNITLWETAINILSKYDTYGCNYNNTHYSGNFWWSTINNIRLLPDYIPQYYTAPEDWITLNKKKIFCINNCYSNFVRPYPKHIYSNKFNVFKNLDEFYNYLLRIFSFNTTTNKVS